MKNNRIKREHSAIMDKCDECIYQYDLFKCKLNIDNPLLDECRNKKTKE